MFKRDGDVLRDDECELGECANEGEVRKLHYDCDDDDSYGCQVFLYKTCSTLTWR